MATGPKIVHKQFNSPIGLYSQQNIKETLTKHMQNLGNGTVGIDFNDPITDKPANLANSAVLRMLEEEERNRRGGRPSQKKVVWPPVPETNGYHQTPQEESSVATCARNERISSNTTDSRIAAGVPVAATVIAEPVLATASVLLRQSVVLGAPVPGSTEELRAPTSDNHSSSTTTSPPETSSGFP